MFVSHQVKSWSRRSRCNHQIVYPCAHSQGPLQPAWQICGQVGRNLGSVTTQDCVMFVEKPCWKCTWRHSKHAPARMQGKNIICISQYVQKRLAEWIGSLGWLWESLKFANCDRNKLHACFWEGFLTWPLLVWGIVGDIFTLLFSLLEVVVNFQQTIWLRFGWLFDLVY